MATQNAYGQERIKFTVPYYPMVKLGYPIIKIRIDDDIIANFVVSTSTSHCLISDKLVTKLRLAQEKVIFSGNKPAMMNGKLLYKVDAPFQFEYLPNKFSTSMIVVSENLLYSQKSKVQLDGMLGCNFLDETALLFNPRKHEMTIWMKGSLSENEIHSVSMDNSKVLSYAEGKSPFEIPTTLNNQIETKMMVGTTINTLTISNSNIKALGITKPKTGTHTNAVTDDIIDYPVKLKSVKIGDITLYNVDAVYSETGSQSEMNSIGMDILKNYLFLIDSPAKKFYLKPLEKISANHQEKPEKDPRK